jgi:trans-aconitate 2-methyltransferase
MPNWNPEQYLKFKNERTQPSIDLISKIKLGDPRFIIDIGCGPGNSTQALYRRWPTAEIVGLDNSEEMIKKAREDYPMQKWVLADASVFESDQKYDLVFSNATLQWIPNHEKLFPRLFNLLNDKGAVAVQVPAHMDSPINRALSSVASSKRWYSFTGGDLAKQSINLQSPDYYYDLLSPMASDLDLWVTIYYHVLSSHEGLIEWYKGTGMRPYLERLPDDASRAEFENEVLEECRSSYKLQMNGTILFPFRRVFFVAYS